MTNRSGLTWADKNGSLHKPRSYRLVWAFGVAGLVVLIWSLIA